MTEQNDYRVKPSPPCVACRGLAHSSVNKELQCLTDHLLRARREIERLTGLQGLTEVDIARNRQQSDLFDQTRGRNKP